MLNNDQPVKRPVLSRLTLILLAVILTSVVITACDHQAVSAETPADYPVAPAFRLNTPDGQTVNLPQLSEQGVNIYLFWATWCPYCKQLMPHLQSIKDQYGKRVNVYAINISENGDPVEYLNTNGYDFTLLLNGDDVAREYGVQGTPGLFLVDESGHNRFDMSKLLAPANKALEGLKHGQRSKRIAPWWAARIRTEIQTILAAQN